MSTTKRYSDIIPDEWYEMNPDIDSNVDVMFEKTKPKRVHVPRGYVLDPEAKVCYPKPEMIKRFIEFMVDYRIKNSRSLRELQDCIYSAEKEIMDIEDPALISLGGVTQLFDRLEKELGIRQTEVSKERIKRIRVERAEKAKKLGKSRPYHYSSEMKKKVESQKRLTQANNKLKELEKERKKLKAKAARQARKLELQNDPTKYQEVEGKLEYVEDKPPMPAPAIIQPDTALIDTYISGLQTGVEESTLSEIYQEILHNKERYDKKRVAFLPTPRQYLFLSSPEDIVLYGGAAGGGKSYAMVIDALRYADQPDYKGVIIRKTTPELRELIDNSRELYPLAFPGAKYNGSKDVWRFPSGAQIEFGFLDKPADKFKYQGIQYGYVGFDELSQHATDEGFGYLRSRLRTTNPKVKPYIRATANPGSQWVYEMFIKDKEPNVPFVMPGTGLNGSKPITMRFIPAKLEDNPHLDNDGAYRAMLGTLSEVERRQLLEGDWLASNDAMFPEFNLQKHVCEPFFVPKHWNRTAGLDYGYRDPSAGVWFAVDPSDGSVVIYDEFLQSGLTGREFALNIQQKEQEELVYVNHPIDWSVFARTGHTGPTIAESMLSVPGFKLQRADKNREAGWVQLHEYLRVDPETGAPKIKIFSTCVNTIKQIMSAKVHKTKPGDLDDTRTSDGHWDLLDALRYGLMSRPRAETLEERSMRYKQENRWEQINSYFS